MKKKGLWSILIVALSIEITALSENDEVPGSMRDLFSRTINWGGVIPEAGESVVNSINWDHYLQRQYWIRPKGEVNEWVQNSELEWVSRTTGDQFSSEENQILNDTGSHCPDGTSLKIFNTRIQMGGAPYSLLGASCFGASGIHGPFSLTLKNKYKQIRATATGEIRDGDIVSAEVRVPSSQQTVLKIGKKQTAGNNVVYDMDLTTCQQPRKTEMKWQSGKLAEHRDYMTQYSDRTIDPNDATSIEAKPSGDRNFGFSKARTNEVDGRALGVFPENLPLLVMSDYGGYPKGYPPLEKDITTKLTQEDKLFISESSMKNSCRGKNKKWAVAASGKGKLFYCVGTGKHGVITVGSPALLHEGVEDGVVFREEFVYPTDDQKIENHISEPLLAKNLTPSHVPIEIKRFIQGQKNPVSVKKLAFVYDQLVTKTRVSLVEAYNETSDCSPIQIKVRQTDKGTETFTQVSYSNSTYGIKSSDTEPLHTFLNLDARLEPAQSGSH